MKTALRGSRIAGSLTLIFALALASTANAQTTATLEGRVVDASGGGIAGATVSVKGPTVQREVAADAKGFYRALALPAGIYSVSVSSPGFNTKVLEGIELFLNRTVTIDIPMQVAAQSESMTVQVSAPSSIAPAPPAARSSTRAPSTRCP